MDAKWASADAARVVQATREFLKAGGNSGLPGSTSGQPTPRVRLDGVLERALQSAFDASAAAGPGSRRLSAPAVVARTSWAGPPKQRLSSSTHEALAEETAEQVRGSGLRAERHAAVDTGVGLPSPLTVQVAELHSKAAAQEAARANVEARVARLEHELVTALDAAVSSTTAEATALRRLSSTGAGGPAPAADSSSLAALEARLVAMEARAEAEARARRTLEQRTKRLEAELATALEAAVSAAASENRGEARGSGGDVRAAVAQAVDQLRTELEASLQVAARGGQGGRHEDGGLDGRVTRLERELGTALEAAVAAAAAEANGGSQRRRGPSDEDIAHVMDTLRSLEARVADADGTVRRCEQEAMRASAAAVSALTGMLAVKDHSVAGNSGGARPSGGSDGSHGGGGGGATAADLNHLRLRVQALETASDGSPGPAAGQQLVVALGNRVEELETALMTIRDALSAMASRQVHLQQQEAAQGAQAQGLAHAQQRLTSLESRVEAAEAALTAASEAASRAETAAAGAAVAAASARRAADEAPRAAAHAVASMGGMSPRVTHSAPPQVAPGTPSAQAVQALAGRVRGCEANMEAVRGDTSNMRHNVDALALVVEQLAGRLDALEGDVAEALRAVAAQLGALEQTPAGSPMMSTPHTGRR